jgi:hypothetical protein
VVHKSAATRPSAASCQIAAAYAYHALPNAIRSPGTNSCPIAASRLVAVSRPDRAHPTAADLPNPTGNPRPARPKATGNPHPASPCATGNPHPNAGAYPLPAHVSATSCPIAASHLVAVSRPDRAHPKAPERPNATAYARPARPNAAGNVRLGLANATSRPIAASRLVAVSRPDRIHPKAADRPNATGNPHPASPCADCLKIAAAYPHHTLPSAAAYSHPDHLGVGRCPSAGSCLTAVGCLGAARPNATDCPSSARLSAAAYSHHARRSAAVCSGPACRGAPGCPSFDHLGVASCPGPVGCLAAVPCSQAPWRTRSARPGITSESGDALARSGAGS